MLFIIGILSQIWRVCRPSIDALLQLSSIKNACKMCVCTCILTNVQTSVRIQAPVTTKLLTETLLTLDIGHSCFANSGADSVFMCRKLTPQRNWGGRRMENLLQTISLIYQPIGNASLFNTFSSTGTCIRKL